MSFLMCLAFTSYKSNSLLGDVFVSRENVIRSWPFFEASIDQEGGYTRGVTLFAGKWRWVLSTPCEITNTGYLRLWLALAVPLLMLWAATDLLLGVALLPLRMAAQRLGSLVHSKANLAG